MLQLILSNCKDHCCLTFLFYGYIPFLIRDPLVILDRWYHDQVAFTRNLISKKTIDNVENSFITSEALLPECIVFIFKMTKNLPVF